MWSGGIVGLYMIEGYLRNWPASAASPYERGGEYLVVMTLHHEDTVTDELTAAAVAECRRYDSARQVPTPFFLMRAGDVRSHVYLCVPADLAAALEQPAERAQAEEHLQRAGFYFSPAELPDEQR